MRWDQLKVHLPNNPPVISFTVAATSFKTGMKTALDSPVWKILFPGFINATRAELEYGDYDYWFYIVYDRGDPIYDSAPQQRLFASTFESTCMHLF